MTSEAEALEAVLARVQTLPKTRAPLIEALRHFAATEVRATVALPAFDNSAMDGYALRAADASAGAQLRVVGEQPAGPDRGLAVGAGEAVRIFTGAPLPAGADAILMQEDAKREGETVIPTSTVEPGEFVRRKGGDVAAGQVILRRGERISPQVIALLAAQGLAEVEVGAAARVAIVSTGDELARPGEPALPGQIYESNSLMLHALAREAGAAVDFVEHAPDQLEPLTKILRRGLEHDALLVSGGVSVGEHDLVKPALRALGAELDLWRVAITPGKPFLFGRAGSCAIFGLPGNPVSAFVTFLKFVRPALQKMAGANEETLALPTQPATLAREVSNSGDRPHYLRGTLRDGVFTVSGRQESHALFGLSRANALLRLAPGEQLAAGAKVAVETW